jgi:ribosomal protein L40E/type II secretory pathway pseudopilin PulG
MAISFTCPACGHVMAIPDRYAGRELFCTSCKVKFTAPGFEEAPAHFEVAGPDVCPSCGATALADAAFCRKCGSTLQGRLPDLEPLRRPAGITVLAVLNGIGAAIMLLFAVLVVTTARGDEAPLMIGIGIAYLIAGVLALAAAIGLWKLRPWGRSLQIGLSIFGLLGFPVGTLVSALILYFLTRPEIKILFSGLQPSELSPQERVLLAAYSGSTTSVAVIIVAILGVVAACGMVSAIAIPNLLNAINRGRQKRSVVDMRTIATALEKFHAQRGYYPPSLSSIDEVERAVMPSSVDGLPAVDGWRTPFKVWSDANGTHYGITSFGRDRTEGPSPGGETTDMDADIVLEDGRFVQWPAGNVSR